MNQTFRALRGPWRYLAAALGLLAAGCAVSDQPGIFKGAAVPNPAGAATPTTWQVRPVRMRVYPSSGLVRSPGQTFLEARVELLDDVGDSVKGVGQWCFELWANQRPGEPATGTRLCNWEVSLRTLEENRRHYDPITRTYVFRLKIDNLPATVPALTLRGTFMTADGQRLETQAALGN